MPARWLTPDKPTLRGTAQNPDVYFQGREAVNRFYDALPAIIEYLQGEGFEFVTVSELLASDPDVSEAVASCDDPMPEGCVWPTETAEAAPAE